MAVEEVQRRHPVVHRADRLAVTDAPMVFARPPLLLGVAGRGNAEAAEPALGGVDLGAGRRHRHPHRRMRLLQRLRQHRSLGHREREAVMREALLRLMALGAHAEGSAADEHHPGGVVVLRRQAGIGGAAPELAAGRLLLCLRRAYATATTPGETEVGSAGEQPAKG